ncbi:MAG: NfeD family protein [Thermoguttaceae bacterium]
MRFIVSWLIVFVCLPAFLFARDGVVVELDLPITPKSAEVARRTISQIASDGLPDTVFVVFRTTPSATGRGSDLGGCYTVAGAIVRELSTIRTVAVIPNSLYGHSVLVALACDEIILGPNAEIGDAADGVTDRDVVTETMLSAYRDVAQRRRRDLPRSLIDKMLDASVEILSAESDETTFFGSSDELAAIAAKRNIEWDAPPKVVVAAGVTGIYTANEARRLGIVARLEDDTTSAAAAVGVEKDSLRRARVVGTVGQTLIVDVVGAITPSKVNAIIRQTTARLAQTHRGDPITLVCFRVDSPGGNLTAAYNLADFIVGTLRPRGIHTVGYVPQTALADAAIIPLCCDETILGERATLGGDGATITTREEIDHVVPLLEPLLDAAFQRRSPVVAMFDGDEELLVWRDAKDASKTSLMSVAEWESLAGRERFVRGDVYKPRGKLLALNAADAVKFRIADDTVLDDAGLRTACGIDNEPEHLEGGMIDQFVRALADPRWSLVLLLIGFFALSAELKTPGLGLGGFLATLTFVLFFWSHFLNGTAEWLELILFATGIVFLLLEIFVVPGFGLFGVGGLVLIVVSIVLAGQTFVIPHNSYQLARTQWSLVTLLVATAGATLVAAMAVRVVHAANHPQSSELSERAEGEKLADYTHLLGAGGVCATPLVPAGRVMFDDVPVNVVADGEFIDAGTEVVVTEVNGYRVVVRRVTKSET